MLLYERCSCCVREVMLTVRDVFVRCSRGVGKVFERCTCCVYEVFIGSLLGAC